MDAFTPGLLARLPLPPRKVILVRVSRIGDFICATPALRALRAALPQADITLLGLPIVSELVARSPHLNRFVEFPGFPGLAEQFFDARRTVRLLAALQDEQFDLAVQMNGSGVYANPFTLLLGARMTAGCVPNPHWAMGLDAALPLPQQGHEIERWLALTTFLGAPPQGTQTEFPLWPEDEDGAEELLVGWPPPWIGLHPFSRERTPRWPLDHFSRAAAALRAEWGGTVVLLGQADSDEARRVWAERIGQPCLDLTGRTSLGTLGAVIARLALLITNDSGPAHIAYALGTPSVTLFGGTDPARWGPLDRMRHTVIEYTRGENEIARVVEAAGQLIRESQASRE